MRSKVLALGFALITLYVPISLFAYALRNPELTQTQVLLGIWNALCWR